MSDFELERIKRKKMLEMMKKLNTSKETENVKICVPTLGQGGLDDYVSDHFGRAPTFTIVDLKTGEVKVIPNTSIHMGGSSYPPEILREHGVDVMLCSGIGPRAIKMFEQFGIEVYVGATGTAREAIEAWKAGKLQEATDENACKMHRHRRNEHMY
ncbi:MAG: NifB/NifX family molybdenum-iron cluster-binding protein [Candidatus Baldrarchaeia archaeon]